MPGRPAHSHLLCCSETTPPQTWGPGGVISGPPSGWGFQAQRARERESQLELTRPWGHLGIPPARHSPEQSILGRPQASHCPVLPSEWTSAGSGGLRDT